MKPDVKQECRELYDFVKKFNDLGVSGHFNLVTIRRENWEPLREEAARLLRDTTYVERADR